MDVPMPLTDSVELGTTVTCCSVIVRDLKVMADIGIYDHEIGVRQPLRISVRLDVVAPTHDAADETFDYANVSCFARSLAEERIALVETFAQRLAALCLAHPLVLEADVLIEKPHALPNCVAGARAVLRANPCVLASNVRHCADIGRGSR